MAKTATISLEIVSEVRQAISDVKRLAAASKDSAKKSEKAWKVSQKRLEEFGRTAQLVGRNMRRYITLPILAATAAASKFAIDFEYSFAEVRTLLNKTTDDVGHLRDGLINLSERIPKSLIDLTEGMYQVRSAGVAAADLLTVLEVSGVAAVAGLAPTEVAVRAITKALNTYGVEASKATDVSDIMFKTVKMGQLKFEDVAEGIGSVVGSAQMAGIELDDLMVAFATATRSMKNADVVAISLNQAIMSFLAAGSEAQAVAERYGVVLKQTTLDELGMVKAFSLLADAYDKANAAGGEGAEVLKAMIPNIRAFRSIAALAGPQAEALAENMEEMSNRAGAAREAFEIMADTVRNRLVIAWNKLKNSLIEFGDEALPIIEAVATAVGKMSDVTEKMSGSVKLITLSSGLFIAVLGPIILLLGGLVASAGKLLPLITWSIGGIKTITLLLNRLLFIPMFGIGAILDSIAAALLAIIASPITAWIVTLTAATITFKVALDKLLPSLTGEEAELSKGLKTAWAGVVAYSKLAAQKIKDAEAARKALELEKKLAKGRREIIKLYSIEEARIKAAAQSRIIALRNQVEDTKKAYESELKYIENTTTGEVLLNRQRLKNYQAFLKAKIALQEALDEETQEKQETAEENYQKFYDALIKDMRIKAEAKVLKAEIALDKAAADERYQLELNLAKARMLLEHVLLRDRELTYQEKLNLLIKAEHDYNMATRKSGEDANKRRIKDWEEANRAIMVGIQALAGAISTTFRGIFETRQKYTRRQMELDNAAAGLQKQRLSDQLRNQEISHKEYNLEIERMNMERREREQRYEEDHANVLIKIGRRLKDAYLDFLAEELRETIHTELKKLAISITTEKAKTAAKVEGAAVGVAAEGALTAATVTTAKASLLGAIWENVKSLAKTLGPVGVIAALAMAGLMIAAFNQMKKGMGFAEGGLVRGKGGPTADANFALLSRGEYVISAKRTRRNFALLEAINSGVDVLGGVLTGFPKFAEGGLVGTTPVPAGVGYNIVHELRLIRARLEVLEPKVEIEARAESYIEGRDLLTTIQLEERSQKVRRLGEK